MKPYSGHLHGYVRATAAVSQFPIACEYCENFKNTFFVQHLRTAASKKYILLDIAIIGFKKSLKIIENVHTKIGIEQ